MSFCLVINASCVQNDGIGPTRFTTGDALGLSGWFQLYLILIGDVHTHPELTDRHCRHGWPIRLLPPGSFRPVVRIAQHVSRTSSRVGPVPVCDPYKLCGEGLLVTRRARCLWQFHRASTPRSQCSPLCCPNWRRRPRARNQGNSCCECRQSN